MSGGTRALATNKYTKQRTTYIPAYTKVCSVGGLSEKGEKGGKKNGGRVALFSLGTGGNAPMLGCSRNWGAVSACLCISSSFCTMAQTSILIQ